MTSELVFLRHGQTDWNKARLFQGQTDIPLNETGIAQAKKVAKDLRGYNFKAIYSSDSSRALQTAKIVAENTDCEVIADERLREINVGTWAGKAVSEIYSTNPEINAKLVSGQDFRRSPEGETEAETTQRATIAVEEYIARYKDESFLVVSHGITIRLTVATLLQIPFSKRGMLGRMGNCHHSRLNIQGGLRRLDYYNRAS